MGDHYHWYLDGTGADLHIPVVRSPVGIGRIAGSSHRRRRRDVAEGALYLYPHDKSNPVLPVLCQRRKRIDDVRTRDYPDPGRTGQFHIYHYVLYVPERILRI